MNVAFFRPRPLRIGIRLRMMLVTLAVGSLFVLYIGFNTARQAERDLDHTREQMRLVAALAGARLDDHLGDLKQLLNALAGTLSAAGQPEANDATLRRLMAQLPADVVDIALWSLDGSNVGSAGHVAGQPRAHSSEQAFFARTQSDDVVLIQAPVRAGRGATGEWTAMLARRVARDGEPVAVVSVSIRLGALTRLLDPDSTLPEGAVIAIANAEGRMVARSVDAERWIGQPAPIDRIALLRRLAEGSGTSTTTGLDGVARIFGFTRARSAPWLVYVGIPVELAGAASAANVRASVFLGLAMLALGLVISAWVAARIALPLRQLSADAVLLGEGRFEHRSAVRTSSEIGLLAHMFNRMAGALHARIAEERRSEERLSLALEGSEQALFDWDIAGGLIHYSGRASTLRGGPNVATQETPETMRAFVHPDDLARVLAAMTDALRGTTVLYEAEFRVRHNDGSWLWIRSRGRVVERDAEGRALRMVGTDADITRRKVAENEMRQRAEFDGLTGLPNRSLFDDRLTGAISRATRSGHTVALLFLDIDHFKRINDTRGHEAGDVLLKIVGQRLLAAVRGVDTVARLAGDEFTVILEGLADAGDAERVAAKLVEALRLPAPIGAETVQVSVSIGVAWLEPGETDPAALLRRADMALYAAKRAGRDRFQVSPAMT